MNRETEDRLREKIKFLISALGALIIIVLFLFFTYYNFLLVLMVTAILAFAFFITAFVVWLNGGINFTE